jgi:hypothetical protein
MPRILSASLIELTVYVHSTLGHAIRSKSIDEEKPNRTPRPGDGTIQAIEQSTVARLPSRCENQFVWFFTHRCLQKFSASTTCLLPITRQFPCGPSGYRCNKRGDVTRSAKCWSPWAIPGRSTGRPKEGGGHAGRTGIGYLGKSLPESVIPTFLLSVAAAPAGAFHPTRPVRSRPQPRNRSGS